MPAQANTNTAILAAQKVLDAVNSEKGMAAAIKANDPSTRNIGTFAKQNILRSQQALETWKSIGRQVLAMHPEVVEEVSVATSDKIYGEVLRTLPYMNPLVVFSDPPKFKPWTKSHSVTGDTEDHMRLLGFLTYGTAEILGSVQEGADISIEATQLIMATNDERANRFGMLLCFEVYDKSGTAIAMEFDSMSLYYQDNLTLGETVDALVARFHFDGGAEETPHSRKWLRSVLSTVVGSLFYLCSTTLEAEKVPTKTTRNLGKGVTRKPLSLYRVGWTIGGALSRYRASRLSYGSELGTELGYQQDPQHRRSHFKMQPCGKNKQDRKLMFISAYWTHKERLGEGGVNTARMVPKVDGKGAVRESVQTALGVGKV